MSEGSRGKFPSSQSLIPLSSNVVGYEIKKNADSNENRTVMIPLKSWYARSTLQTVFLGCFSGEREASY